MMDLGSGFTRSATVGGSPTASPLPLALVHTGHPGCPGPGEPYRWDARALGIESPPLVRQGPSEPCRWDARTLCVGTLPWSLVDPVVGPPGPWA